MYVTIVIKNWKKYNDRKDVRRPSWFRMEHSLFDSSQFYGWPAVDKLVWVYLLCEASKQANGSSGLTRVNTAHMSAAVSVTLTEGHKILHRVIKNLKELQMVEVRTGRGRYTGVGEMPSTYGTNVTNVTNVTNEEKAAPHPKDLFEPVADPPALERSGTAAVAVIKPFSSSETIAKEFVERQVSEQTQSRWVEQYPDVVWLNRKVLEAIQWEADNPSRRKRKFGAFLSRWLAKDWERRPLQYGQAAARQAAPVNLVPKRMEDF